jgi:transposase
MKKINTVQIFESEIFKEQRLTIGMDLGDRWSCYCILDETGRILLEQKVATTPEAMKQAFAKIPRSLIAMETGTHSPWVSRLLTELEYKVIVAHAQKVQLITKSNRKDDRHDARTLARLARIDPELLGPVRHRSAQAQIHLTVIRARAELVRVRTALVNAARGLAKSYGQRLPKCGTQQVSRQLGAGLPAELREVLEPLLKEIESLNERIQEYEVRMEKIAKESYPHVELLKQVKGVGTQIALTYVLTLEDPQRFPKSREVGCFLGLKPGRRDSGESQPQMRISKEGDRYLRTMLVQGAHYILGPFGADSDLRRWGLKLAARGGANAKKRAVVAVARKLAVLLHRLWVSGEVYEPLRNSQKAMRAVAYSEELPTKQGMLGLDGIGDRRREAILVRNLSAENWKIQEERKRSIPERREMVSEQPSSTAEIR